MRSSSGLSPPPPPSSSFTVVSPSLFSRGRLLALVRSLSLALACYSSSFSSSDIPLILPPPSSSSLPPPPVDERPFCLARPRSTLRPVIKQPRGGQIESVEETRERRRRGDGQLAATMVSIVKGPSWCFRVGIGARPDRTRGKMWGERGAGGGGSRLAYRDRVDGYIPGLEPPNHPPRARGEFGLWTAAHRVLLPASLSDDVALTPRPL